MDREEQIMGLIKSIADINDLHQNNLDVLHKRVSDLEAKCDDLAVTCDQLITIIKCMNQNKDVIKVKDGEYYA